MPPRRRSNIGRRTRLARSLYNHRVSQTEAERTQRSEAIRVRLSQAQGSTSMTQDQRLQSSLTRTPAGNERHNLQRRINRNSNNGGQYERLAFRYGSGVDYATDLSVDFGTMSIVCQYCNALKFRCEPLGLCCASGKVKLPQLLPPPEPLASLLSGQDPLSKNFLQQIQLYNTSFQMTSFGANIIQQQGFNPTFKIQGQIHHRAGALLPPMNSEHKVLQIYFLGNTNDEINQRCATNNAIKREIIAQLQNLLHEQVELVKLFKTALDMMPSDDHKIVIRADKRPFDEHERRFNAPTLNEVAVVIVGENLGSRDIVLSRRDGNHLQRISETHRSYDALQYPLIFPRGEDGYHFLLKMISPISGQETNKKISSMNFYAYRLMIRNNKDNHILKCRRLFHQFVVDMYAKIETERLTYIRLNQKKLRTEEYIHLRDAINTDGNANNVGRFTILPSTYVGSPRHLHEYAQDAMTYVREYGRPDLFITFTCGGVKLHSYYYPANQPAIAMTLQRECLSKNLRQW